MNLKQIVEQINRQLTISDSYEERRLLKIKESEDQLIYSEDDFDFFFLQGGAHWGGVVIAGRAIALAASAGI